MKWYLRLQHTLSVLLPLREPLPNINLSLAQASHHGSIVSFGVLFLSMLPLRERTNIASGEVATRQRILLGASILPQVHVHTHSSCADTTRKQL
jgi:hypothetical protein